MSQWTHFAAVIRFDGFRALGPEAEAQMKPDLGKTWTYDTFDLQDDSDVPAGSEGSIQHQTWVNPDACSMAAYTSMIWGDLRDYADAEELCSYLARITHGKLVRQGVAEIQVEGRAPVVVVYADDCWRNATLAKGDT